MARQLRSRTITQGVQRSPNRAMLRAVGFDDLDFDKPIVGVANAYSTITPCNVGLDGLARRAEAALRAAGVLQMPLDGLPAAGAVLGFVRERLGELRV